MQFFTSLESGNFYSQNQEIGMNTVEISRFQKCQKIKDGEFYSGSQVIQDMPAACISSETKMLTISRFKKWLLEFGTFNFSFETEVIHDQKVSKFSNPTHFGSYLIFRRL